MPQAREIGVIGQQVADHHAGHAHAQRARQRALRIAHFAGQVVEVVEPAVGKQHRQQRTGERPRRSRRGRPADQRHAQMFMRQHQAGDHQQCNRQQLEHGEHVLQPRAGADTEQVDAHDEHDRAHRHRLHERRPIEPQRAAQVFGEHRRHRCHAAGIVDQRHGPAEQERRHQAERLAQIDVDAAGLRPARTELGVAQHAGQGESAADRPQDQQFGARRRMPRHRRRSEEDARTDHAADDDHRGVPGVQAAGVGIGGFGQHAGYLAIVGDAFTSTVWQGTARSVGRRC